MKQLTITFAALCLLSLAGLDAVADSQQPDLPGEAGWLRQQPLTPLAIVTRGARCWQFRVWVARTPEQFARGLMFVRRLPADGGMLFALTSERDISMWMRNTYVSLDLLFADADGRIVTIHERAEPLSLTPIAAGQPVWAVLELPAGTSAQSGIAVGDLLRHEHFGNRGCND